MEHNSEENSLANTPEIFATAETPVSPEEQLAYYFLTQIQEKGGLGDIWSVDVNATVLKQDKDLGKKFSKEFYRKHTREFYC